MLDHLELKTATLDLTARFYAAVLAPLGYNEMTVNEKTRGFGGIAGLDFFIIAGTPTSTAHYAFRATDRATVRACWEEGRPFNALERAPAIMAHIHPDYYAGFLRDPDQRLVEFVCHEPER